MTLNAESPSGSAVGRDAETEIIQLLQLYVEIVDSGDIHRWPDLFALDASYQVISRDNLQAGLPLSFVLDDSRGRILDRVTYIHEVWKNAVNDYVPRHLISLPRVVGIGENAYHLDAAFAVYATSLAGESNLLAVGTYDDEIVYEAGSPRIRSKRVIVDTTVLPRYFIYPL